MKTLKTSVVSISEAVIKRTISEVSSFTRQFLGLRPASVFADFHDVSITITLSGILPEVEKVSIAEKHIAELISRNYLASYNAVRHTLEAVISDIIGQRINHSTLLIDPRANVGTILCTITT